MHIRNLTAELKFSFFKFAFYWKKIHPYFIPEKIFWIVSGKLVIFVTTNIYDCYLHSTVFSPIRQNDW